MVRHMSSTGVRSLETARLFSEPQPRRSSSPGSLHFSVFLKPAWLDRAGMRWEVTRFRRLLIIFLQERGKEDFLRVLCMSVGLFAQSLGRFALARLSAFLPRNRSAPGSASLLLLHHTDSGFALNLRWSLYLKGTEYQSACSLGKAVAPVLFEERK